MPIGLCLFFMIVNPFVFPRPKDDKSWATRAVLGQRLAATELAAVALPAAYRQRGGTGGAARLLGGRLQHVLELMSSRSRRGHGLPSRLHAGDRLDAGHAGNCGALAYHEDSRMDPPTNSSCCGGDPCNL